MIQLENRTVHPVFDRPLARTEKVNQDVVTELVYDFYDHFGYERPRVVFVDNPIELAFAQSFGGYMAEKKFLTEDFFREGHFRGLFCYIESLYMRQFSRRIIKDQPFSFDNPFIVARRLDGAKAIGAKRNIAKKMLPGLSNCLERMRFIYNTNYVNERDCYRLLDPFNYPSNSAMIQDIYPEIDRKSNKGKDLLYKLMMECFDFTPSLDYFIVCDFPNRVDIDEKGRLHSHEKDTPAINFRGTHYDDYEYKHVYFEGEEIARSYLKMDSHGRFGRILAGVMTEETRQRLIRYEGGLANLLMQSVSISIEDRRPDPSQGSLVRWYAGSGGDVERGSVVSFLVAECPRNGMICERVPNHINTVREAQAWRVGLSLSEFEYPTKRT